MDSKDDSVERPADDTADTDMAWDRYLEHLYAEQHRVEHKLSAARSTSGLAAEASAGSVGRKKCVRGSPVDSGHLPRPALAHPPHAPPVKA